MAVVGPCSIHDPEAAIEYATRLAAEKTKFENDLLVVMRVYFEKPRTTIGWKGLINDPNLNGSFDINKGLRVRSRPAAFRSMGSACPPELNSSTSFTPQYIADLVSWGSHWRTYYGKPGAPAAGFGAFMSCGPEKRDHGGCEDCRGRSARRIKAASVSFNHKDWQNRDI